MPSAIVTATFQATVLNGLSNLCAQFLVAYRKQVPFTLSLPELARFLILTILTAPLNFHWQHFLERAFPSREDPHAHHEARLERAERGAVDEKLHEQYREKPDADGTGSRTQAPLSWKNTFLKWFTDCITMGALFNTVAFLALMGLMKGKTLDQIRSSVRTETIPIIWASYKLWPFASVINFTLVPVERRIVFLSAVGLCWGIYMSIVASECAIKRIVVAKPKLPDYVSGRHTGRRVPMLRNRVMEQAHEAISEVAKPTKVG